MIWTSFDDVKRKMIKNNFSVKITRKKVKCRLSEFLGLERENGYGLPESAAEGSLGESGLATEHGNVA